MQYVIIPLVIMLAAVLISYGIRFLGSKREIKGLKRSGRYCSWKEAQTKVMAGDGYIIINRTNLFGSVWWISKVPDNINPFLLLSKDAILTDFSGNIKKIRKMVPEDRIIEVRGVVRVA